MSPIPPSDEEARAEEYRRAMQAREDNLYNDEVLLAGDPSAYRDLYERFSPLLPDTGWDPTPRVVPVDNNG